MNNNKQLISEYFQSKVQPIFNELIARLLIEKPDDVLEWSKHWIQEKQNSIPQAPHKHAHKQSEESDEDEQDEEEELIVAIKPKSKVSTRSAVSAEAYGHYNKVENFKARVIEKTAESKQRIKTRILNSFMFSALEERELNIVIDAMEEKKFQAEEWVIQQGHDGNELYVIDAGNLDCYKKFTPNEDAKYLKRYVPGESFGELALLYNAPRAASIKAVNDVITFALDRDTFNNIVKQSAVLKREKMETILSKIELLQSMDSYERTQLSDGMRDIKFQAGATVIKQIYLIAEGHLAAYKQEGDEPQHKVYEYKEGDYFGELALLKHTQRQATVIATTDVHLLYCDFQSFRRLMGPLEEILLRNVEKYAHFINQ